MSVQSEPRRGCDTTVAKCQVSTVLTRLKITSQKPETNQNDIILVTCTLQDSSCIYVTAGWHYCDQGKHHGRSFWDNAMEGNASRHISQERKMVKYEQNVKNVSLQYCKMNGDAIVAGEALQSPTVDYQ